MRPDFFSKTDFIGYASSLAGYEIGAEDGPAAFYTWLKAHSDEIVPYMIEEQKLNTHDDKIIRIQKTLTKLAKVVAQSVQRGRRFTVIGGDHSCAIGTWSGVANQLNEPFSLIWVDAHMDAHTMETSPSKNIHGMPVAHLLGQCEQNLKSITNSHPAILPEHLFLIGVRSYEKEEALFLKQQGIRVYDIDEVNERGIQAVLKEVLQQCQQRTTKYGFSIDVDAFDALQMPGTSLPVEKGLCVHQFLNAISQLGLPDGLLGLEIAEYNPHLDVDFKTAYMIQQIISCLFSACQVETVSFSKE